MRYLSVVVSLAMIGCGGDGDTAVEKCDDLVATLCDRVGECAPSLGTVEECVEGVHAQLSCGSAQSVSATYGRCISQLRSISCSGLFPADPNTGVPTLTLPADCQGVILTPSNRVGDDAPASVLEGASSALAAE